MALRKAPEPLEILSGFDLSTPEGIAEAAATFDEIVSRRLKTLQQLKTLSEKLKAKIVSCPGLLASWSSGARRMPKELRDLDLSADDLNSLQSVLSEELILKFENDWAWAKTVPPGARLLRSRKVQVELERALLYWWRSARKVRAIIRDAAVNPYPLMAACLNSSTIKPSDLLAACDALTGAKSTLLSERRVTAAAIGAMALAQRQGHWSHVIVLGHKKKGTAPGQFLKAMVNLLEPNKIKRLALLMRLFKGARWRRLLPITPVNSGLADIEAIQKMYPLWPFDIHIVTSSDNSGTVRCHPAWMRYARTRSAKRLIVRLHDKLPAISAAVEKAIKSADVNGKPLDPKQKEALRRVFALPVSVISGKPGTGKTAICRVIAEIAQATGLTVRGYAPTGRAAKRLEMLSGIESRTIHSALLPGGHARQGLMELDDEPLDIAVVDEASMLDTRMIDAVLAAAADGGARRLVLIGDPRQLPPVEGIEYFPSLIEVLAARGATTELDVVHRHDERTLDAGLVFDPKRKWRWGKTMIEAKCSAVTKNEVAGESAKAYGQLPDDLREQVLNWVEEHRDGDWQILAFTNGMVELLNSVVRVAVTGGDKPGFVPGDRIKQRFNDYELDLRNGEQAIVTSVSVVGSKTITAQFEDGREITVTPEYARINWTFAWASTVHSAQGGQWDDILIVMPSCDANLTFINQASLYTAITRVANGTVTILSDEPEAVIDAARRRPVKKDQSFESLVGKIMRDLKLTPPPTTVKRSRTRPVLH